MCANGSAGDEEAVGDTVRDISNINNLFIDLRQAAYRESISRRARHALRPAFFRAG
jgi:hypothetical protein